MTPSQSRKKHFNLELCFLYGDDRLARGYSLLASVTHSAGFILGSAVCGHLNKEIPTLRWRELLSGPRCLRLFLEPGPFLPVTFDTFAQEVAKLLLV